METDKDPKASNLNKEEIKKLLNFAANNSVSLSIDDLRILYNFVDGTSEFCISDVHQSYSKLCQKTSPVTGHTIISSLGVKRNVWPVLSLALLFFVLVLANELMAIMFDDGDIAEGTFASSMMFFQIYFLDQLSPVLWGGLGSCVYLMKFYADLAKDKLFDLDKAGGWGTRVVLGSILGGIIQYIYSPELLTSSGIDNHALAFLVGLSVKVVYGALEKTIEAIADKMNLDSTHSNKKNKKSFREMAIKMAANKDLSDEDRYLILQVLDIDKKSGDKPI